MLKYETLLNDAFQDIPEFANEYKKMVKMGYFDDETGKHIVFSWAFVPLLKDAILNNNTMLSSRMLSFLEKMASSDDHLVQEVCDFTVLEELCDQVSPETVYPLLGKSTKEGFHAISRYMNYN